MFNKQYVGFFLSLLMVLSATAMAGTNDKVNWHFNTQTHQMVQATSGWDWVTENKASVYSRIEIQVHELSGALLNQVSLKANQRAVVTHMANNLDTYAVVGTFSGSLFLEDLQLESTGDRGIFLLLLNFDGVPMSLTHLAGLGNDVPTSVVADAEGFQIQALIKEAQTHQTFLQYWQLDNWGEVLASDAISIGDAANQPPMASIEDETEEPEVNDPIGFTTTANIEDDTEEPEINDPIGFAAPTTSTIEDDTEEPEVNDPIGFTTTANIEDDTEEPEINDPIGFAAPTTSTIEDDTEEPEVNDPIGFAATAGIEDDTEEPEINDPIGFTSPISQPF
jgi:hypothetical protein